MASTVLALLVPMREPQDARDGRSGANAAAHGVRQSLRGADALHQPRGEAAAENFIEDLSRVVVGIVAANAQLDHADVALVHVVFGIR